MADILKLGFTTTTPFKPNCDLVRYNTDPIPTLQLFYDIQRMTFLAPIPVMLLILESTTTNDLKITLDLPVLLQHVTEVHGATIWNFGSPVTGSSDKQFIVPITVLNRLLTMHNGGRN